MAVYVDPLLDWGWKYGKSCHMIADTNEELHSMAERIGLKREWFQKSSSGPHYDLTSKKRDQAIRAGAVALDHRQFHKILNEQTASVVARIKAPETEEERQKIRDWYFR